MTTAVNPLAGILPDLFTKRETDDKRNCVETGTPGTFRFDGLLAGLFGRTGSGDRNDPANYSLFCPSCGAALGVLGRWRPWPDGTRAVRCTMTLGDTGKVCDLVTILDKTARIIATSPGANYDAWIKSQTLKSAHHRALERVEEAEKKARDKKPDNEEW
jgi:hypothetical protein